MRLILLPFPWWIPQFRFNSARSRSPHPELTRGLSGTICFAPVLNCWVGFWVPAPTFPILAVFPVNTTFARDIKYSKECHNSRMIFGFTVFENQTDVVNRRKTPRQPSPELRLSNYTLIFTKVFSLLLDFNSLNLKLGNATQYSNLINTDLTSTSNFLPSPLGRSPWRLGVPP